MTVATAGGALALGLVAGPASADPPHDALAIFSYAGVAMTSDDVWECADGTSASAQIQTGVVVGDVLKSPINSSGKPFSWMDVDINWIVVNACDGQRHEVGEIYTGSLLDQVTPDQYGMDTYESAFVNLDGPIEYFDANWVPTDIWVEDYFMEWHATGSALKVDETGILGMRRSATAQATGTMTVHGLPASWNPGWDGSITFVADSDSEAWLGRCVHIG